MPTDRTLSAPARPHPLARLSGALALAGLAACAGDPVEVAEDSSAGHGSPAAEVVDALERHTRLSELWPELPSQLGATA